MNKTIRTNMVLFPYMTERLLKVLRESKLQNDEIRELIKTIDENSSTDELGLARGESVMDGLDDNDWDGDDLPAISAADGESGAYVQCWRWVTNDMLPEDIQKKYKIGDYAEEEA